MRRLVTASLALLVSCGPAVPQGADHPASADAPEARAPALATALTGDPAPPPDDVGAAARAYALDDEEGVHPPVIGAEAQPPGAPRPSRAPGTPESEHDHHGGPAHDAQPPAEPGRGVRGQDVGGEHAGH